MKLGLALLLGCSISLLLARGCRGDTPANCTYEDLLGTWVFQLSRGGHDRSVNCSVEGRSEEVAVKLALRLDGSIDWSMLRPRLLSLSSRLCLKTTQHVRQNKTRPLVWVDVSSGVMLQKLCRRHTESKILFASLHLCFVIIEPILKNRFTKCFFKGSATLILAPADWSRDYTNLFPHFVRLKSQVHFHNLRLTKSQLVQSPDIASSFLFLYSKYFSFLFIVDYCPICHVTPQVKTDVLWLVNKCHSTLDWLLAESQSCDLIMCL